MESQPTLSLHTPANGRPTGRSVKSSLCLFLAVCFWIEVCPLLSAAPPAIFALDLRYADSLSASQRYDIQHAAVCAQGIVNRDAPRVFLIFHAGDATWLDRLVEEGGLCEGWRVERLADVEDLVSHFRARLKGLILYDPDPNAPGAVLPTSLAATTAAACEGRHCHPERHFVNLSPLALDGESRASCSLQPDRQIHREAARSGRRAARPREAPSATPTSGLSTSISPPAGAIQPFCPTPSTSGG